MTQPEYPPDDTLQAALGDFAALSDTVSAMLNETDAAEATKVNRFDPNTLILVETLRGGVRKDRAAVQKARKLIEQELGAGAWRNWYHVLRGDFEAYFEDLIYHDDDFIHSVIQWHRGVKSTFHFAFCQKMFVRLAAVRAFVATIDAHTDSLDRLVESLDGTRVN